MSSTGDELEALASAADASAQAHAAAAAAQTRAWAMARAPAVDEAGRLAADLLCLQCGYNLRGLPRDGRCPECGRPVHLSLDQGFAGDPAYTVQVVRGCTLGLLTIAAGAALWFLLLTVRFLGGDGLEGLTIALLCLLLVTKLVLGAAAVSNLAAPEAIGPATAATLWWRRLALISPFVAAGCFLLGASSCLCTRTGAPGGWLLLLCLAAVVVGLFALWRHLARLTAHLPAPGLALQARILSWVSLGFWAMLLAGWFGGLSFGFGLWQVYTAGLVPYWFWWVLQGGAFLLWPGVAGWSAVVLWLFRRRLQRVLAAQPSRIAWAR